VWVEQTSTEGRYVQARLRSETRGQEAHGERICVPFPVAHSIPCWGSWLVIVPVLSVLIGLIIVRAALRRAPLLALVCIGLIGFALHTRVVTVPAAIRTPVVHLTGALHEWQQRQAAALSCDIAQARAIRRSDEASLDTMQRLCDSVRGE
jgi:hypothetical protein